MKTYITTLIIFLICFFSNQISAQDASPDFATAKSSYSSGNLDDARFALEQTLNEIDQAIGKEILKLLPTNLSGMPAKEQEDNVVGTNLGFAGLFVDRYYGTEAQTANVQIIGDSPLMAGLNAMLALPAVMTAGDQNQKRVKIDGYKSLLQKEETQDGTDAYNLQIPANSTLITLNCKGCSENQVISMASTIPISQIVKLAQ